MFKKLLLFLILGFYIWTATGGTFTYTRHPIHLPYYNMLKEAFLNKRLHLSLNPPHKLLALPNPYDPEANKTFRRDHFQDLSLFKGKVYLYFGATPVITLYIPYYFLTRLEMYDSLAVLIFMFGTLIWGYLILGHLKNKYFKQTPEWMLVLSIAVLGFSNLGPYLLRRPMMYEVAISCGCFFLTGGIFWLLRGIEKRRFSILYLALGSLFIGLAASARPNLLVVGTLLPIIWFFIRKEQPKKLTGNLTKALFIPFLLCVALVMLYNFLRFENTLETGLSYQLGRYNYSEIPRIGLSSIFSNINSYLFECFIVTSSFPFFHPYLWEPKPPIPPAFEKIVGIVPGVPFVLLILISPFLYFRKMTPSKEKADLVDKDFPLFEFFIVIVPALTSLFFLLTYRFVTLRYATDFYTLLILATAVVWYYFDVKLSVNKIYRNILRSLAIILATFSIIFGIAFSIEGPDRGLIEQNNEEFKNLEAFFKPMSKFLSSKNRYN